MNTLAHMAGTLGLVYLTVFAFATLNVAVLGWAMLSLVALGFFSTIVSAFQDADAMGGGEGGED